MRGITGEENEPPPGTSGSGIPVVGLGASAGGFEALAQLIPAIPVKCGMAFVVIQHLDPEHTSALPTLLSRMTSLEVIEIDQPMSIETDRIYVVPPNAMLAIKDNELIPKFGEYRTNRNPIDSFLSLLAENKGERGACVILSGTGSDGTQGLRAIKEKGGLTIAQKGAEYDGMMRSAVGTGQVDYVLEAAEIPQKLCDYFEHLAEMEGRKGADGVRQETADHLGRICALLRTRTGHDFSGYKDKTVARRVQRRMQVLQIEDVGKFIERLRKDPQELDALLQDLLIGVTNFFRDPKAFEALESKVIPQLFAGKGADDTIRIWVPGCSTGEEAYSIGILLREHMSKEKAAPKIIIFASDIDEQSLQIARMGRFPSTIAKDVPPRLLERYFVREDGTYRIASELREICLFSSHNLLRDAPFSKLDLISCRNLLIYLTPELQNRIVPLFHYALNDGAYLFLGSSENVTRHPRLFAPVDKAARIFQRRPQMERRLPEFPLTPSPSAAPKNVQVIRPAAQQDSLQSLAERQLIERYSPAYVVINGEGELLHSSTRTGKYLELPPGAPRTDIFSMARRGLRPDLRAIVHRAVNTGKIAMQPRVAIGTNGGRQVVDLVVHPLPVSELQEPLFMVVFQDVGGIEAAPRAEGETSPEELESANLRQLEMELQATKERLQTTTEELESSNEELKSGNEELSSMNEELQSANEELETSKEELQSINEELQTVNSELNARVEELSRANSDIANLLESTQIATVFLDRDLAVKSFTPAAKDVFRLVESDTGRPISHVRARFASDTVQEDAERVLRTLITIERQVNSNYSNARYVMRMMPYRTIDGMIAGVVITFMDVTKITAAEARINQLTTDLRNRVQSLETLLDLLPVGIILAEDPNEKFQINRYGSQLLVQDVEGAGLRFQAGTIRLRQNGQELAPEHQPLQQAIKTGIAVAGFEGEIVRSDGRTVDVMISATPLFGEDGKVRGGIAAIVDISDRKRAEAHQQILLHELQHRVKNIITTISALAARMVKGHQTLETFSPAFLGRLTAMARAHELLSRGNWTGATIRQLLETALVSHMGEGEAPVTLAGPDVLLPPNYAATMGMVLYELATNAVKYGALSVRKGRISVVWTLAGSEGDRKFRLTWTESNGPAISDDVRQGFGTGFIKQSVAYELSGEVQFDLLPTGLECAIEFPLKRNLPNEVGVGRLDDG